jgi:hypothetical protein
MVLGAVGCAVEHEPYATAVWSDTDASWLVVRGQRRIDDRCGIFHDCETTSTTANHELWIHPTDGGEPRQLVGRRDGAATDPYFMESAGYVLVNHNLQWEQIMLDGEVRIVERSEDSGQAIYVPSPEGDVLARVMRSDCSPGCINRVSFVDARSLEPTGPAVERRIEGDRYSPRIAWTGDGSRVYVGSPTNAIVVSRDGTVDEEVEPPSCTFGTTSSTRALDGRTVGSEVVDGMVQLRVGDDGEPGWPEQCFDSGE